MIRPVLRFAPSPTGYLHLGHAASALLNAEITARLGGRLLLRIEDIDPARSRPEHVAAIREDLAWLGLGFDEEAPPQSTRTPVYAAALARLQAMGLVYPCACSRAEIARAAQGRDPEGAPLYPGTCRPGDGRAPMAGAPVALRLDMWKALARLEGPLVWRRFDPLTGVAAGEVAADPAGWGDVVLARKETPTSYHLAVVVDDAAQGVTHVVRGADLARATDIHRLLQALLGLPTPLYHHHPLLLDASGEKLAKSRGSPGLRDLRAAGLSPADVRGMAGFRPDVTSGRAPSATAPS